ncbi:MAG: ABC transporter ATP-binding protein [Tissierellia bacterium]|nr:ABC transporter ATP-binding protein [Tissierellia bacterium]
MELRVEGINKAFINNGKNKEVLKDISFEIEKGQFISLLGPSGCGKTTLLTIIAGFQKADSGLILVGENKVTKAGPDRGFVFQNYALFPWMTVKDNILFPMKQIKMGKAERQKRLEHLLTIAQLNGQEHLYPHQISGGMKQRTALVRALATTPDVLLMDEPLGALDHQMRQSLQSELEDIWLEDRTTVVMVTHDVDEAVYLSDRVIVMSRNKGKIVADMPIELGRPRNRKSKEYEEYKNKLENYLEQASLVTEE